MNRLINFLFSSRLMAIIVLMFAISIGVATFIENDFGSQTARAVVYNTWWFNLLLFIGIINLTGTIIVGRLYRKEKLSIFLFHLAFLFILTGAAITRFFGFEGFMHIRSGESSNQIISSNNYFQLSAISGGLSKTTEKTMYFSPLSGNRHKLDLKIDGKKVVAECLNVIPNAVETIESDPEGEPMVELVTSGLNGRQSVIVSPQQPERIGEMLFSMNDSTNMKGVNFYVSDNKLEIRSSEPVIVMNMASQNTDTLPAGKYHPLQMKALYNFSGIPVVPQLFSSSGRLGYKTSEVDGSGQLPYMVLLKISSGTQSRLVRYYAMENAINAPAKIKLGEITANVTIGAKAIQIPFAIQLKEFILERYPGSLSPSWFESKIILSDSEQQEKSGEQRVYMNNILKHRGYRFYQSSYDSDELGTIFSVNHDYAGTFVTYFGYLLLAIGIVFSIFNKNSRFKKLTIELNRIRATGKMASVMILITVLWMASVMPSFAQLLPDSVHINEKHAGRFGALLIQDPGGRIKPVNTLSSELLRKVSRKTMFMEQTPDQVFLGMLVYPEYWQNVPMIRVSHPEIKKLLHIQESFVSFRGVLDPQSDNPYILNSYVNEAYQKKPANRNKFDTEIIRLDERVNLCYQVYSGNLLRIFPARNDSNNTWYSPVNYAGVFKDDDSVFVTTIIPLYLQSLTEGSNTRNFIVPDEALLAIENFQNRLGSGIIPSTFRIKLEILYNRINLFDRLGSAYGLIGFILLVFQFISIFAPGLNTKPVVKISTLLIYVCFGFHLAGLAARWFISGHAPWSNAYESLVYIAFATVLAGLIFSRKSSVTLSVTSLLAWIILFVAHLNWMDPQITNLVPVLKSYWLLIHVAIITASYGFLALGALMAFTNLILMILQTKSNLVTTGRMVAEFSLVIEMTLIIGLYMLTIGTFLGGVWANESWGRYWGWDPKETWALVSILIYAFVAHMRLVPGLKGNYIFNLMALLAFSTIIMTYFGVNYYLSGMHSYAKGDPVPVPDFVYYTLAVVGLVTILSWENQRRLKKRGINSGQSKINNSSPRKTMQLVRDI